MSDYSKTLMMLDEREIARVAQAKTMVLSYPGYSEETKNAWLDALDGVLETRKQAYENARQALEEAFSKRK